MFFVINRGNLKQRINRNGGSCFICSFLLFDSKRKRTEKTIYSIMVKQWKFFGSININKKKNKQVIENL